MTKKERRKLKKAFDLLQGEDMDINDGMELIYELLYNKESPLTNLYKSDRTLINGLTGKKI